jgi:cell division protein ZapA (FtsZ GTPase activity inhibitor)
MKTALAAVVFVLVSAGSGVQAQTQTQPPANRQEQAAPPANDINSILLQVQQATSAASVSIGKLRIEKWKTDASQKQQLQQVADSLQKNIANAVPGMVNAVQTSRGGVLASFKLYHDLNVLYEFLSTLADAAGGLGKKEEYEPLAADAAALDAARQNLSTYIEQTAGKLESANQQPNGTVPMQARQLQAVPGKKVVVIDDNEAPKPKRAKPTKKKSSNPPAAASPQPSASPH